MLQQHQVTREPGTIKEQSDYKPRAITASAADMPSGATTAAGRNRARPDPDLVSQSGRKRRVGITAPDADTPPGVRSALRRDSKHGRAEQGRLGSLRKLNANSTRALPRGDLHNLFADPIVTKV